MNVIILFVIGDILLVIGNRPITSRMLEPNTASTGVVIGSIGVSETALEK
jgi:hypothetical protein